MSAILYHNPRCGTSRNVLALIQATGTPVQVIEYLKTPPSFEELQSLTVGGGVSARELIRQKEPEYLQLGLDDPSLSDDEILKIISQTPTLLNRPVLKTESGARVCRPSEVALEILPPLQNDFAKEDGEIIIATKS